MKKMMIILLATAVLLSVTTIGHAVPPEYKGQFGNPEEPALRVVKWPILGFRKLVVSTHDGLHSGIHKSPCAAVHEGACGFWCGMGTFIDHTARGMVYAPLPPKAPLRTTETYEELAMQYIEHVTALREEAELAMDEEVDEMEEAAEEAVQYLPFRARECLVDRAQRRYVPERTAARDRVRVGEGNLLRLAR